jgi:protein involved in polysaccharide export with SLBB domain
MTKRVIFFIWTIFLTLLLFPGIGHALTADEICRQKNLTPEQCQLLKARLAPTGGQVTPEAVENLRNNVEFSRLKPEDIQQGRELLEKQEALESRAGAEKAVQHVSAVPAAASNPAVSEEGRAKSLFDRVRHTGKYQDISTDLKPFGHDFFRDGSVRVVAERKDIPVPVNYVVGPGDEVKIMLWGRVNAQHNLTVDRDGRITLPEIGPIFVAGMTFEQMSEHIITQTTQMVGANIDITMGSLKSIPVFVLGDVRRPGAYTIGSFATITDALLLAGGANDIGSMRNVQLKRKGRLVTAFDLYNLLLKGDKSKDLILQAGDVVFVPVTGPLAGIAGNVKRPAIYEMKDRYDLEGLFELAGGIIPSADTQQIQVSRIQKNERQVVIDIDDKNLQKSRTVRLQDADLVKVFSIVDRDRNAVYLEGNIKRPGKYQFRKGMRVGDLIKSSDELLDETCFEYALIKRIVPPDRKVELVPFHLGKMLKGRDSVHDVELRPEDRVYVFSKWLFEDKPYVTVEGEIRGECRISQETMEVGGESRVSKMDSEAKNLAAMEEDLKKEGKYALAERLKVIREAWRRIRMSA